MPTHSGESSHGNNPSLDQWATLANHMAEVEIIHNALDDQPSLNKYTDGTMYNFVRRLDVVIKAVPGSTPTGWAKATAPMLQLLRNACRELNLAAAEYGGKRRVTRTFLTCIEKGRIELEKVLDIWRCLPK